MSQIHHLYIFNKEAEKGRVFLVSSDAVTFVLAAGKHTIKVRDPHNPVLGKHIGILPVKEASVISTRGLEWDVQNWKTEFGGSISTSNHVKEDDVYIETSKDVLFTIDFADDFWA